MTIPQLHMYDLKTGEYTGSRDATRRPNGEYMLERPVRRPLLCLPTFLRGTLPAGPGTRGRRWKTIASIWTSAAARKAGRLTGFPATRGVPSPGIRRSLARSLRRRFWRSGKVGRGAGARSADEDQGAACGA